MKTRQKIPFYQAEYISLDAGIRQKDIPMFDICTNRQFGTISIQITARGLLAKNKRQHGTNLRGITTYMVSEYLYEFSEEYKETESYKKYMTRY
jgi:hypothetical protein